MCGIAGFLDHKQSLPEAVRKDALAGMTNRLAHRGPNGQGLWTDAPAGVGLGHRRLSVIDPSDHASQPMVSKSGRYILTYNGEIYNTPALRARLEGPWRGHSDTEVMLAAFEAWGVEEAIKSMNGMFAFALWDRQERVLTLARDRVGEKPVYYAEMGGHFLFGSEIKALKVHPAFRGEIDRDALCMLLQYNYIPAPYSIYRGVKKLLPGHYLSIQAGGSPQLREYWSATATIAESLSSPLNLSDRELTDRLETALRESVRARMVSDVPLGAFLSGGVDSSTIVALMQAESVKPVRTFTVGFHTEDYNEAAQAKAVAEHLRTDHTELYVSEEDARRVIPKLPSLYDEPFADASQIPTFLVSEMTQRHVTVALSGDAGDELFGGYNRHVFAQSWPKIEKIPLSLRKLTARTIDSVSVRTLETTAGLLFARKNLGELIHKLSGVLGAASAQELYRNISSFWATPQNVVQGAGEPHDYAQMESAWALPVSDAERMMASDLISYLPNDILVKLDRAGMGVSLETRVPFLDPELIALAWRMPLSCKIRGNTSKWILRQVLYRHVPQVLIERPKMGFGVPIRDWLRGPLEGWAEDLLSEKRLREEGYFHPGPIRAMWDEHLSGRRNRQYHLWSVLMFQSWLEAQ